MTPLTHKGTTACKSPAKERVAQAMQPYRCLCTENISSGDIVEVDALAALEVEHSPLLELLISLFLFFCGGIEKLILTNCTYGTLWNVGGSHKPGREVHAVVF